MVGRFCVLPNFTSYTYLRTYLFGQNFSQTKLLVGQVFVASKDFGHFCLTNNFVYFEISKYD